MSERAEEGTDAGGPTGPEGQGVLATRRASGPEASDRRERAAPQGRRCRLRRHGRVGGGPEDGGNFEFPPSEGVRREGQGPSGESKVHPWCTLRELRVPEGTVR